MRQLALAIATITVVATISAIARADMVGAAAGAGSGLVVAGPAGQLPVEWSVGFLVSRSGVRRSVTAHAGSTTTSNATAGIIIDTIITESRLELRPPAALQYSPRSAAAHLC
jgi:hypothetical protein